MGTAVPLEAQEGNKYILILIMKAFVAYALAAFAAIAANPIEATPFDYQSGLAPAFPYAYVVRPPPPRTKRYADQYFYADDQVNNQPQVARPIGKRHANEQYRLTYKRGAYEENDYTAPA